MPLFDIRRNTSHRAASNSYEDRRRRIVESARQCFEQTSVDQTGIVDVTREAGIVRELFYYYFPDKESLRLAVAEQYAEEALALARLWCSEWRDCDWNKAHQAEEALASVVVHIRRYAFTSTGARGPMSYVLESEYPHYDFYHKLHTEMWRCFSFEPALQGLCATLRGRCSEEAVTDVLEFILFGIQGYLYEEPTIPDESLARMVIKLFLDD